MPEKKQNKTLFNATLSDHHKATEISITNFRNI